MLVNISKDGEMAKSSAATGCVVADKWSIERLNQPGQKQT